jgi:hypothetical protein
MEDWKYGSTESLTLNHIQPTANRQPPTANRQPPTANRQPPTANHYSERKLLTGFETAALIA